MILHGQSRSIQTLLTINIGSGCAKNSHLRYSFLASYYFYISNHQTDSVLFYCVLIFYDNMVSMLM